MLGKGHLRAHVALGEVPHDGEGPCMPHGEEGPCIIKYTQREITLAFITTINIHYH